MVFAQVNGLVLHYQVWGVTDAPVIVFSNSLGTDLRIWEKVAAELARDYRIVLYDKRGHGLSDAPPAPYRMEDHVEDLASLLRSLDVAATVVVGLSVGGMIAQGLAHEHPDLVRGLVLCDTAHKVGTEALWNARIDGVNANGLASMAGEILQRWFTPPFCDPENPVYGGLANMLIRTPVEGYAGTCAAIRDADLTRSTGGLDLPTICLVGDQDCSTPPERVRELSSLIRGARFEIIEGAGHIPCVEQPEAMTRLIREFCASLEMA